MCTLGENGEDNFCICETGWQSAGCDSCIPYWQCPNQEEGACNLPNECICPDGTEDPKILCDHHLLRKTN